MTSLFNRRFAPRAIWAAVCLLALFLGLRQQPVEAQHIAIRPNFKVGNVEVLEARPNMHVIFGAGGNVIVQDGWMGIVVVDTGSKGQSDQILNAIKELRLKFPDGTDKRIRMIINTGADPDHI